MVGQIGRRANSILYQNHNIIVKIGKVVIIIIKIGKIIIIKNLIMIVIIMITGQIT